MNNVLEIIPFKPLYAGDFKTLNLEWLKKYFTVEPYDALLLEDCESEIIAKGGVIFFGKISEVIIGTYALIYKEKYTMELAKMAITETHQNKGYGQNLLKHAINYAKKKGQKNLILYSNRKLNNSIYLYRKYGFIEIPIEENNPYARGNIKMVLKFN